MSPFFAVRWRKRAARTAEEIDMTRPSQRAAVQRRGRGEGGAFKAAASIRLALSARPPARSRSHDGGDEAGKHGHIYRREVSQHYHGSGDDDRGSSSNDAARTKTTTRAGNSSGYGKQRNLGGTTTTSNAARRTMPLARQVERIWPRAADPSRTRPTPLERRFASARQIERLRPREWRCP